LEEGEGGHRGDLTICVSDSEFNADSFSNLDAHSNTNTNSNTNSITNSNCICDPIANPIAKCDNSSHWLLCRKVE